MKKKLIWCVQHNPVELLLRVARDFAEILGRYTDEYEIEVLTQQEYADYYNNGVLIDTVDMVHQGLAHVSQTFVTKVGYLNTAYQVFDLPYLFEDHDHVRRVLEGKIGSSLLKSLENNNRDLKGLAFTYSGGYRIFCSDRPIESIDSLKGRRIATSLNPVQIDVVEALGAVSTAGDVWERRNRWFKGDEGLIEQTTWVRYKDWMDEYAPYVLDAQHSLFLTVLIMNIDFWNSLPDDHKDIFMKAATEAAANEKKITIADTEKYRQQLKDSCQVIILDKTEIDRAKKMLEPVYDKWNHKSIPNLVKNIRES